MRRNPYKIIENEPITGFSNANLFNSDGEVIGCSLVEFEYQFNELLGHTNVISYNVLGEMPDKEDIRYAIEAEVGGIYEWPLDLI